MIAALITYQIYGTHWQKYSLLGLKFTIITFIKQLLNRYYKTLVLCITVLVIIKEVLCKQECVLNLVVHY